MINKIYKIINNKFSRFFKFIFFLRYLFTIFFVATVFFLLIPNFFDYQKKEEIIKSYLSQNYNLDIKKLGSIKFFSFPTPNLEIDNLTSNFSSDTANLEIQKLKIYPTLLSIYNYDNFEAKKIRLENSHLVTDIKKLGFIKKNIFDLNKKIYFKNLNLEIEDNKDNIIDVQNIDFFNYGYKKNNVKGEIFNKKFIIKFQDDYNNIDLKLKDTGVSATLTFLEKKENFDFRGSLKGKILKSNFKLDLIYNQNSVKIDNFYFRDEHLSFDSNGLIELNPYFQILLKSEIKNLNLNKFQDLDIKYFLSLKELFKRLNSQNEIIFKSKKFSRNLIDNLDLKVKTAYGRLNIEKNLSILNTKIYCKNDINLLDEFPILYFNCELNSPDKKRLLKKIKIDYKKKDERLDLKFLGNLNILNKKINFDHISLKKDYKATREDLIYYKKTFENIFLDEEFFKIFQLLKLRKFVKEIS